LGFLVSVYCRVKGGGGGWAEKEILGEVVWEG